MPVPIKIKVWVVGNQVELSPNKETIHLKVGRDEEAEWRCYVGDIEIVFDKDTPFEGTHYRCPKGGALSSGVPRQAAVRTAPYKYTVAVTINNVRYEKDPYIVIDN